MQHIVYTNIHGISFISGARKTNRIIKYDNSNNDITSCSDMALFFPQASLLASQSGNMLRSPISTNSTLVSRGKSSCVCWSWSFFLSSYQAWLQVTYININILSPIAQHYDEYRDTIPGKTQPLPVINIHRLSCKPIGSNRICN